MVNDNVTRDLFDKRRFSLKFPTIDEIVQYIVNIKTDPVIYKIDVARAFRNLRFDPVDTTKFGIQWDGLYYLDQSVAFGWTHGSAAFQMVSDAVTFIMHKHGATVVSYSDDYIGIAEKHDAMRHFDLLHNLPTRSPYKSGLAMRPLQGPHLLRHQNQHT